MNMGNKSAKHAKNNGKEEIKKKTKVEKKKEIEKKKEKSKTSRRAPKDGDTVLINLAMKDGQNVPPEIDEEFNPKNGKKKKHKVLKIVLSILMIIVIVIGCIFGKYVYDAGGSISGAVMNIVKDVLGDQDPVFILVMGVSEDISVELTDTIILIGYNPDTNQAFMLSIPRDTFVGKSEASAGGYDKINALYQTNPEKTVAAVEDLTGVKIDYYVTVKTGALVKIVDIIGGVDFDVPMNMDYDDDSQDLHIHLKAGEQTLNGDQAEQLVRFRHNNNGSSYSSEYGDNDIGRMRTQREFIKVVGNKLITTNDVDKLKEIAKTVFENLSTNMSLSTVLTYIPYAVNIDVENNLSMDQLPGTPALINELWFYKSNTSETQELMNSYADKLGLSAEEKAKYFKPITRKSSGGGSSSKKTTSNDNGGSSSKNTTVNNTVTNTVNTNTTTSNSISNKNEVNKNSSTNNTVNGTESGNGNSGESGSGKSGESGNESGSTGSGNGSSGESGSGSGSSGESGSGSGSSGESGSGSGSSGESGSGSGNSGESGSESGNSGKSGSGSNSSTTNDNQTGNE